jgi:glycosyltransferase involved in cell wall biosynthesis
MEDGMQAGTPRVSIIVPHLNTPELLVRALQALSAQRIDHGWFEILVVDNGSRMPLDPIMHAWAGVRFLVEHTPGPGPARNLGVAHARSDILAFVDADVRVLPGWLQAGLDALGDGPGPIGGDVRIDVADGTRLTGVEAFECVFSFRQRDYIRRRHYSVTANLMCRRCVFDKAGPFGGIDTPEDRQFGERAFAAGYATRFAPAMRALHPPRASYREMQRKWQRLTAQAFADHIGRGRSLLAWRLRAAAVALSWLPHMPRMLGSRRVHGVTNRLAGASILVRIRLDRALDMLRQAREAEGQAGAHAFNWNR